MLGLSTSELLIIAVILVVLFGATRVPRVARALGQSVHELRVGASGEDRADEA